MNPKRDREVTAGGMTRVAAVVASLAESSLSSEAEAQGNLTDLIAKAAQEMEQHAGATRMYRVRGMAQRGKASVSLTAAKGGAGPADGRKLDVRR